MPRDLTPSQADALARVARLDAAGPGDAAIRRAKELSSILPKPAPSGLRAWFDRTVAAIASLDLRESALAVEGVRRLSGPQVRAWTCGEVRIEVEIERLTKSEGDHLQLRGQIEGPESGALEGRPIVALDQDGRPLATALVEVGGYFELDAPVTVRALAFAAAAGAVICPDVVDEGNASTRAGSDPEPEG